MFTMQLELPVGDSPKALSFPHFPTGHQAVVWRNWELVPVKQIARVLAATEDDILKLAEGMGLRIPPQVPGQWLERGYITIIRANWHLLTYEQLLALLGWSSEKLAYTLKEDDFLFVKLGNHKPFVEPVTYYPLTEHEKIQTDELRKLITAHFPPKAQERHSSPFDFLQKFTEKSRVEFREYDKGEADGTVINNSWRIEYPALKNVDLFVERFASHIKDRWGIELDTSMKRDHGKKILLESGSVSGMVSESHEIAVSDENIKITAVDGTGLLRGLQWLEKEMEKAGGPCIKKGRIMRHTRFTLRLIYSYFAVYGDPLIDRDIDPYPDELLNSLSKLGINGIWLQGVLYNLVHWEKAPGISRDCEKRIEGLKQLVARAAAYGIGVYLYLNEPRAMPLDFFELHPELKGHTEDEFGALCTSQEAVRSYLWNGVHCLFKDVPDLAGIITITMSENLTNCYSRASKAGTNCPRCRDRSPQEVIAEVNGIIADAARSAKPDARVICWNWGWNKAMGWDRGMVAEAIGRLPDGVSLMCTSEDEMQTCTGGIKGYVEDYSMSNAGPGEKSIHCWQLAAARNLKPVAKVQLNNTWECSAVPYLPVMDLVVQHLESLVECGVSGLMLGWTLGGYPSLNLELASQYYWKQTGAEKVDAVELAASEYGRDVSVRIGNAWSCFSRAFREFPFNLMVLYTAPQNFGPSNLLYLNSTGYKATMIGFPYDDMDSWRGIYPEEVLEEQFKNLSIEWKNGLEIVKQMQEEVHQKKTDNFADLQNVSEAAYCHFRSTYLQIAYTRLRNRLSGMEAPENRGSIINRILDILAEEIEIAKMLHGIVEKDSRIGFEASNHYYYTLQDLKEKVLNCEYLRGKYIEMADTIA